MMARSGGYGSGSVGFWPFPHNAGPSKTQLPKGFMDSFVKVEVVLGARFSSV
jgi:hypothetical protein